MRTSFPKALTSVSISFRSAFAKLGFVAMLHTTISHVCGVVQLIQSSSELSKRLLGIGAPLTVEERACERLVD